MSQMAFEFTPPPDYTLHSFLVGESNRAAFDMLHAWPDWPAPAVILVGPRGTGKTHLMSLWRAHAHAEFCAVENLGDDFNPTRFALRPVGVDDAHSVAGQIGRERALFHLYNLTLQNKQTMVMTANAHPAHWGLLLPDLASRLRAAVVIEIAEPDETLMRKLYLKLFANRQLNVPETVIDWLLTYCERSAAAAAQAAAALDRAALEQQKPITLYLARKILGENDRNANGEINADY